MKQYIKKNAPQYKANLHCHSTISDGRLTAEELKADVIKYPHHGITPCNSEFLEVVDPIFGIVTNRSKDVSRTVHQLEGRGIPGMYSGDGTVYLVTDGTDWYVWQTEGQF